MDSCALERQFRQLSGSTVPIALHEARIPPPPILTLPFVFKTECYIYTATTDLHTSTLKMGESCTSETSATLPTSTRCNNPTTETTLIIKHRQNLKLMTELRNCEVHTCRSELPCSLRHKHCLRGFECHSRNLCLRLFCAALCK
jgi:hypothetical protein